MSSNVRRLWTKDEDQMLRHEVEHQLSQGVLKNWKVISEKLPGRTNKDCRKRWSKVCEPVKKGAWSNAENERLEEAVNRYGFNWIQVAQVVESRHADQCAKRWRHSLDPSIDHSRWTEDEDSRLLTAVELYGHDWRAIGNKEFQGRSPTNIKNRHVLISRKGYRSLICESPPSSTIYGSQLDKPDDSFDEDSDPLDSDVDDSNHSLDMASIPNSCSIGPSTSGSTGYNTGVSAAHTPQSQQNYLGDQTYNFLSSNELFSMPPIDPMIAGASDQYFWDEQPMTSSHVEQWKPTTNTNSAIPIANANSAIVATTAAEDTISCISDRMSLDSEKSMGSHRRRKANDRRRSSVGKRLVLDNVQPETVSGIVKMLFESGANIKMRLESNEATPEDEAHAGM